jgi:hypothetical protein
VKPILVAHGSSGLATPALTRTSKSRDTSITGVKRPEQSLIRHGAIATLDERSDQLPIDRPVYPDTHPQKPAVRRYKEVLPPKCGRSIDRTQSECDRWPTLHHLEGAEGLPPYPKVRMIPGRRFSSFRERQTDSPGAREHRSFEWVSHRRSAVNSVRSSTKHNLLPKGSLQ